MMRGGLCAISIGDEAYVGNQNISESYIAMEIETERLNLVDVGGAGGLKGEWHAVIDQIRPIVFEPNPSSSMEIKSSVEDRFNGVLMTTGLSDAKAIRPLHLTSSPGCVSVLEPNHDFLNQFSVNAAFEVRGTTVANCERYDDLYAEGRVPLPDCIKIDVQGYEYQVLRGFGSTLESCLGIELETHLYPIYKDQRLFHDLITYLSKFGLMLRRTRSVPHFDGYEVELDAWFTPSPEKVGRLSPLQLRKLELIEKVWDLPTRTRLFVPESFL